MKLSEIIDLESLQQIQDCFCKATGFAAIAVDYQGKPLLKYSGFSKFCSRLREDPFFNECCRQSDAHGSLEAVRRGGVYAYQCHAGLVDFAVPIIVDGEYVASMLCGQVRAEEPDALETGLVMPSDGLFSDDPALREEFENIPLVSAQRINDTANLLYRTLNYIVEQHLLNQKNMRLLQAEKERVELEKQYKDLEIKFYHAQVNPLFLFNALNVAGRQAYLEKAQKTQDIIFALADMYRCYHDYSGLLITVEQELMNLKNYLFIQEIRYGERLQFSLDIPMDIRQYMLPAMTLQLFVENAIRHGLEPKENLGSISVKGRKQGDTLLFEIADNGVGMSEQSLALLNDKEFVQRPLVDSGNAGVFNVLKRLQYFFPEAHSATFRSSRDAGTTVLLTLPAREQPEAS